MADEECERTTSDDLIGAFSALDEGSWPATEQELRRAKCLQAERERGVRRITENLSIVPGSLVEELTARLGKGENVLIHCGRVVTLDEFLACSLVTTVEITEGENGKKIVKVDGKEVKQ